MEIRLKERGGKSETFRVENAPEKTSIARSLLRDPFKYNLINIVCLFTGPSSIFWIV
jgi:hypothetical protein